MLESGISAVEKLAEITPDAVTGFIPILYEYCIVADYITELAIG